MTGTEKLRMYSRFVRLEHTVFSLPLLYAGAWLGAGGWPGWRLAGLILLAGAGARTVALGLNRVIDRALDARNPRTADRELPSGRMSIPEAWGVIVAGGLVYVLAAALISNACLLAAPVPIFIFAVYPFMKRFTHWAHLGVGAGLALAPLGGWLAGRGQSLSINFLTPALWLSAFTLAWVTGFDIIYATLDEAHDRATGIHSLPARYGRAAALRISAGFHIAAFLCLAFMVATVGRPRLVWTLPSLAVCGALLWLEHRRADDVEFAFFKVNAAVGFAVLSLVWVAR